MKAIAYLFRIGQANPVTSVKIEVTKDEDKNYRVAAHELLKGFRIEIEKESDDVQTQG